MKLFAPIRIRRCFALLGVVMVFALMVSAADAQKSKEADAKTIFLNTEIAPFDAFYIVRADVNVRAKAKKNSKKVGKLKEGARIFAVGRAKGGWVAYRDHGTDIGFVYEAILYPVINSALEQELSGKLSGKGLPECAYTLTFTGKSAAEGQIFQIGDYEIDWVCKQGNQTARFSTPMFLTEGPYMAKRKSVHQITIDILDLAINLEEVLSTNFLFDHEKMLLTYDGVSRKRLARAPQRSKVKVASLADALQLSVRIAFEVWNETLWLELLKRQE